LAANDVKRSKKSHMTLDKHDAPDLEEVIAVIPWWRPDLKLPEDIAEEVVRVIGYDKIPSSIPPWLTKNLIFDNRQSMLRKLRDLLYGIGLFEVMTYSFVSSEKLQDLGRPLDNYLKLKNPLSSEQAYLRDSLLPSHLDVLERNRTYSKTVGFYEISKTFIKSGLGKQPDEPLRLAVMMNRQENAYRYLKGALDALAGELNVSFEVRSSEDKEFAPGRSGEVYLGDVRIGRIGQVHPNHVTSIKVSGEAAFFEIDLYPLLDSQTTKQFMGLERFPTIQRDLGIIVPMNVSWQSILDSTQRFQVSFVEDYYGKGLEPGYKAVTVRINVTGADRTPTEADAVELESKIFGLLERKVGAKRRD
jgi:phenylalanyl-tRNA synthetase beta chain